MSLLACAARPLLIGVCFERLARTPLTLSRSEKLVACVSVAASGSIAEGAILHNAGAKRGAIENSLKRKTDNGN